MVCDADICSERDMVDVICEEMSRQGLRTHVEVPCFDRNIDIVVELPFGLAAIECKVRDWRRGLIQARHHLLCLDYCFVCLPRRTLKRETTMAFEESGIGLLLLDPSLDGCLLGVVPASKSTEKLQAAQDRMLRAIGEEED